MLAKQENWLGYNASRPGPIWFTFYNHPLTQIPFSGGPDEVAAEIFAKTREALNDVRFTRMVALVGGLLNELEPNELKET